MKKFKTIFISQKLGRYLLIGVTAFATEYLIFTLLTILALPLVMAQSVSFISGLAISFLGNRKITFKGSNTSYAYSGTSQAWRYATLAVFNLILSNAMLHGLVEGLDVSPFVAKVIVMGAVVGWNYLIFSKLIFRTK